MALCFSLLLALCVIVNNGEITDDYKKTISYRLWGEKVEKMNKRDLDYQAFKKAHNLDSCPCSDVSLCDNINKTYAKELYGFGGNPNVSNYNWTHITTVVPGWSMNVPNASDFMCYAHSKGVRLIYWISGSQMPITSNVTARQIWIQNTFEIVSTHHYDGVTFDWEWSMGYPGLTNMIDLVNETTEYFHTNMVGSTTSFCVSWTANTWCNRNYDYSALANASDFLYIMGYNDNYHAYSQQCLAMANAPYQMTQYGIQSFIRPPPYGAGIDKSKIILGVPFYAWNYTCLANEMESPTSKYCPIRFQPYLNYNCSMDAGSVMTYPFVMNLIDNNVNITEIRWDTNIMYHYFNFKGYNNSINQVWYDDPDSLGIKYKYAMEQGIRGVGPFEFDFVFCDFSSNCDYSANTYQHAQEMWSALDIFYG